MADSRLFASIARVAVPAMLALLPLTGHALAQTPAPDPVRKPTSAEADKPAQDAPAIPPCPGCRGEEAARPPSPDTVTVTPDGKTTVPRASCASRRISA